MSVKDHYHLDYETFSEADLTEVGHEHYARHPSTEVLCFAVARNDEEPLLWVPPECRDTVVHQSEEAMDLFQLASETGAVIIAHNAGFERAITNHAFDEAPLFDDEQWHCTSAMARRAALPASLAKVAAYLGIDQQKDKGGAALIRLFCMLQKPRKLKKQETLVDYCLLTGITPQQYELGEPCFRVMPHDQPEKFAALCNYCLQDVRAEQGVYRALKGFDASATAHQVFLADMIINSNGFPVDLKALNNAKRIIDDITKDVRAEFDTLTGLKPTQRAKVLEWLQERGYQHNDLQGPTMEKALGEPEITMTPEGRRALELRAAMSFASVAKVESMLACAGPHDNRVRGTLYYHGPTTGRWSSKLVQQQNFKRPTMKDTEDMFCMLRSGAPADMLELCYGPAVEVISNCIRHFINDEVNGKELLTVDYAAIEARIVCWVAGQDDAVTSFARGDDRYKVMAGKIFRCDSGAVTKDQRFVGKQTVLGCGYGMGADKFLQTCVGYGQDIGLELAQLAVTTFREEHPEIVRFWYACESAAKRAVLSPGQKFHVGKVCFFTAGVAGKRFLFIRLPAGRCLAYPEPAVTGEGRESHLTFFGNIKGSMWGRVDTYGGKIVENIVQGIAADCMGVGAVRALQAGFEVVMLVHDECVVLIDPLPVNAEQDDPLEHLMYELTAMPSWADGLPLTVEGERVRRYKK